MSKKSLNFIYKNEFIYILKLFKSNFLNYKFLFNQINNETKIFDFKTFLKSFFNIVF